MRSDSYNRKVREKAIVRQRLGKQATISDPLLGNESASNAGGTTGGGVFYAARIEVIYEGHLSREDGGGMFLRSFEST
jgi:hypothetical protein